MHVFFNVNMTSFQRIKINFSALTCKVSYENVNFYIMLYSARRLIGSRLIESVG